MKAAHDFLRIWVWTHSRESLFPEKSSFVSRAYWLAGLRADMESAPTIFFSSLRGAKRRGNLKRSPHNPADSHDQSADWSQNDALLVVRWWTVCPVDTTSSVKNHRFLPPSPQGEGFCGRIWGAMGAPPVAGSSDRSEWQWSARRKPAASGAAAAGDPNRTSAPTGAKRKRTAERSS